MKNIRKIAVIVLLATMMLTLTACGAFFENLSTTTTEHVQKLMDAYTSGDVETFQNGLEKDNKLNYMMNAIGDSDSSGMKGVYQKVYELTKDAEITVVGVSKEQKTIDDTYITVKIKTVDFSEALQDAMMAAAAESGEAFEDMPGWMMEALNTGGVPVEVELDVDITVNGKLVGKTQEIFDVLTGGFYDYIAYTMTTCEYEDGGSYMIANYDTVLYSLDDYYEPMDGYEPTQEELNAYIAMYMYEYKDLDGLVAGGSYTDDAVRLYQFVDYNVASTYTLKRLGIISSGTGSYISLNASVNGYEAEGIDCETTDFGSGVLAE